MKQKTLSLTEGNIWTALLKFSLPFMLANALQLLYGGVDLFVVGHYASTADTSAVSVGSQVMSLVSYVIIGFSTGATVLLGQYSGAGDEKRMREAVGNAAVLFTMFAVILTIPLFLCSGLIAEWMKTPQQAMEPTREYLMICTLGIIFITGYNVVSSILRGLGDSKSPLLFVAVACVVNIVLDFILVNGMHMGAAGAAVATITAQAVSFLFSLFYLGRKGIGFAFSKKDLRLKKDCCFRLIRVGMPLAMQSVLVSLSFLIITATINKMGVVASAAVGVDEKLINLLMLPSSSISSAVAAMTAQNIGAGRRDRAYRCMWIGIGISLCTAVLATSISWFRGEWLTQLFSGDSKVIAAAALYLKTYGLDCIMVAFVFIMNGYFTGTEHTMFTMLHSLATTLLIRIPVTVFVGSRDYATLELMGLAAPLSTLGSLVLCLLYLRRLKNKF